MFHQDDTQSSSTTKLVQNGESASSASARKLERSENFQIGRSKMDFHNMQISDHHYLEEVSKILRKKLNLAEEAPILDVETNILIWRIIMSTTMKAAAHLGPNHIANLEVFRNINLPRAQEFVRYLSEID